MVVVDIGGGLLVFIRQAIGIAIGLVKMHDIAFCILLVVYRKDDLRIILFLVHIDHMAGR